MFWTICIHLHIFPPAVPLQCPGYFFISLVDYLQPIYLNPIPHGIFFSWLPRGGGFHPPYGKSTSECLSPILFYTVTYTYIRSSDPKGFFPSFKTLDLVADQSSAANSTYASNFQRVRQVRGRTLSGPHLFSFEAVNICQYMYKWLCKKELGSDTPKWIFHRGGLICPPPLWEPRTKYAVGNRVKHQLAEMPERFVCTLFFLVEAKEEQ